MTVKRKAKKIKLTKYDKASLRAKHRAERAQKQRRAAERLHNDGLIVLLTHFIERHYGNPALGRRGLVITGPVGARLSHAASLRALLIENEPVT